MSILPFIKNKIHKGIITIKNKNKISIIIVITTFLITTTIVQAQIINDYPKQINEVRNTTLTVTFSENDFVFKTFNGYDVVYLNDGGVLNEIGKPMLPIKNVMVALPNGIKATSIKIIDKSEKNLLSSYDILPTQKPQKIGFSNINFIKDYDFYQKNVYYPSSVVELTGMADLAGQAMAIISIYPIQYNPSLKTLKLLTKLNFAIEGETGYICGDYLSNYVSETELNDYQQKVKAMVINPEDVVLKTNPGSQPLGVDPGDYDYVIITQASWISEFQPLANWKTKKGIPANIVTTDWIYNSGGYSGTNIQKIKAFIQDVYTNWGTIYVLLGGDIDVVPCHYRTFSSVDPDPVPNDVYYADFDGDWICEVNIGRASVSGTGNSTGQIGNFINKVFTYEKNPPLTNYALNAAFFGFDLDSWTHAQQCKINIDNSYIPASWPMTTVYDNQSGNHKTNVINALNAGQNLANHADHSGNDAMGVGYVNHDLLLYNSDMDGLSNGNKQTILYSMGCDPAAYDVDDCIAEHFVQNSNGGGIAFIGNSRYGWYEYSTYDSLSMEYDIYFFKSLFQENLYKLGAAFSDHKNDVIAIHSSDNYYRYCYTELTLLGDPELPIWMNNPLSFVVSHPSEIPVDSSSFTVHVQATNGSNIQNAYVCIWKTNEVYLTGLTNSNGNITFNPVPSTSGVMTVTITKQDYLPYEGNVTVSAGNQAPSTPSNPNPANGTTGVNINADLSWTCSDPDGDPLTFNVYFGTSSNPPLVSSGQTATNYNPGAMNFNTNYYWKIVAYDNHSASTTGPLWSFTTEINDPPNTPSSPSPANGATNVDINAGLSWSGGDPNGDTVTFDIYFGTSSPPPLVISDYLYTTFDPGTMQYDTSYYWKINAVDVHGASTMGPEWNFVTEEEPLNYPPEFSGENPSNGATSVPITTSSLSVYISDREGENFSWTIETSPNVGGNSGSNENNGTKVCSIYNLDYNTTYTWFVNATDPGSGQTTSKIYTFTTESTSNQPPNEPDINGPISGNIGTLYTFIFTSTDPNEDDVQYYIEWGDGTITDWTSFQSSGSSYSGQHAWTTTGYYIIKAKAKDSNGEESDWATFEVSVPRSKAVNTLLLKLLNNHPYIFKLLQTIFQRCGL